MPPFESARSALGDIVRSQDAAWCAGDAITFASHALPDIVFTNIVGMFSVGLAPFIAQHEQIFSTIYKGSRLAQEIVHLTMATDAVAIIDTLTSVFDFNHLPPGVVATDGVLRTRLEQVVVLRDGVWRVQSFHNVAVSPVAISRR